MSTQFMLVDWEDSTDGYTLSNSRGPRVRHLSLQEAMETAYSYDASVRVNQHMPDERLDPVLRYAAAAGKKLYDENGALVVNIRYITREEIGKILPEGWFIEQQASRYAACHGEDMTLPYRATLGRAILDIYAFLAAVTAQSASELVGCIAARLEKQDNMFE